jgi:hypothetical protein
MGFVLRMRRDRPDERLSATRLAVIGALSAMSLSLAACVAEPGPGDSTGSPSPTITTQPSASPSPSSSAATPTPTAAAREVLIVTAELIGGELQVSAMVPDISETGGKCTLELQDAPLTSTVDANAGNGVTYCGLMTVVPPDGVQTAGFRVVYESATTRAESPFSTPGSGQ